MIRLLEMYISFLRSKQGVALLGLISGFCAALTYFFPEFNSYFYKAYDTKSIDAGVPLIFLLIAVAMFALLYLQSGKASDVSDESSSMFQLVMKEFDSHKMRTGAKIQELSEKLEVYENRVGLSPDEKESMISGVIEQVNREVVTSIFAQESNKFRDELVAGLSFDKLASSSNAIVGRLKREIADLRLRANINLIIGMLITTIGVYLLWQTVLMVDTSTLLRAFASEGEESNSKFIKNLVLPLIPRVMLVVFVEVFAYFFLSLYKGGLSEIKYFQNELTNVESKLAAVQFSYVTKNEDGIKLAIESLSKTERNFILEKGQATVDLEKAKSESELTRNIIKTIPSFFKKGGK